MTVAVHEHQLLQTDPEDRFFKTVKIPFVFWTELMW